MTLYDFLFSPTVKIRAAGRRAKIKELKGLDRYLDPYEEYIKTDKFETSPLAKELKGLEIIKSFDKTALKFTTAQGNPNIDANIFKIQCILSSNRRRDFTFLFHIDGSLSSEQYKLRYNDKLFRVSKEYMVGQLGDTELLDAPYEWVKNLYDMFQ